MIVLDIRIIDFIGVLYKIFFIEVVDYKNKMGK